MTLWAKFDPNSGRSQKSVSLIPTQFAHRPGRQKWHRGFLLGFPHMLTINRTGSIADVIAAVRDVPVRLVPYAAATALTRTAKYAADTALPAEMRKVFQSPVSYTLKSLRIEPATKDSLSARVMVKNQAPGTSVKPENYLQPEVEGGGRKHKQMEVALRYSGVLSSGQYAMPGKGMKLDAHGNVKGADVRTVLKALKAIRSKGPRGRGGRKLKNDLFAGLPRGGNRPHGIWRREGRGDGEGRLRPLFIFTNQTPSYAPRLDFTGVVQSVAHDRFAVEFEKAMAAMVAKGFRQ